MRPVRFSLAILVFGAVAAAGPGVSAGRAASSGPPPPPKPYIPLGPSALKAVPAYTHSGDIIHLSGTNLRPKSHIYILDACPAALDPVASQYGNYHAIFAPLGPLTDKHGNFVNFTFKDWPLNHVKQSSCTIYTAYQNGEFGPDIPATYYILPKSKQLPVCSRTICAGVSTSPHKVRSGRTVHISIHPVNSKPGYTSWPGAAANVRVSFQGVNPVKITKTLDWSGSADLSIRVPDGADLPSRADIHVTFRMGAMTGMATDAFTIVK